MLRSYLLSTDWRLHVDLQHVIAASWPTGFRLRPLTWSLKEISCRPRIHGPLHRGRRACRRPTDRLRPLREHRARIESHATTGLYDPNHACLGIGRRRSGLFTKNLGAGADWPRSLFSRAPRKPPRCCPTNRRRLRRHQPGIQCLAEIACHRHQHRLRIGPGRDLIRRQTGHQVRAGSARQDRRRSGLWAATMMCVAKLAQDNGLHTNTQGGGDVSSNPPNRSRRSCRSSSPIKSRALSSPRLTTSRWSKPAG